MVRLHFAGIVLFAAGSLQGADSRFGLPLSELEKTKQYRAIELTGNRFAMTQKSEVVVAAMTYGGPDRYYVDVAVSNRGSRPLRLADDFVRFHKDGSAVPALNTLTVASQLREVADRPMPRVAAARVTPASFVQAARQNAAVAEQQELIRKGKETEKAFATHVSAFAHEKQSLELAPGKMTLYTFIFEPEQHDAMPFELCIVAGEEEFKFEYKK